MKAAVCAAVVAGLLAVVAPTSAVASPRPSSGPGSLQLLADDGRALPATPRTRAPRPAPTPVRVGTAATTTPLPVDFLAHAYTITPWSNATRPYALSAPLPLVDDGTQDDAGVHMVSIDGVLYDHPVVQAQFGIECLESFRLTGDPVYLDRAKVQAGRLIAQHVTRDAAWFFPYPFDFALHQTTGQGLMKAPWFSAMAQGMALDLFTRLSQVTGDTTYSDAADAAFESFLEPPDASLPWVVHNDAARNLWLEEYPLWPVESSDFTMNGHIFALYGLIEYWTATRDDRALALVDGALRTVAVVAPVKIRNPGWLSNYCITHGHPSSGYHHVHLDQFLHLHALTGDGAFVRLAESLQADYPDPHVTGRVALRAGPQRLVLFRAGVTTRRTVTLAASAVGTLDSRRRFQGIGVLLHVTSAPYRGWWVVEAAGHAYVRGAASRLTYLRARRMAVRPGVLRGVRIASDGVTTVPVSARFSRASSAPVDASAVVDGVRMYHVMSGALRGAWIPMGSVVVA